MIGLLLAMYAAAAPAGCNTAAASPSVTLELPGSPFAVAPSKDGCWLFVSLADTSSIAVIERGAGRLSLKRVVPVNAPATGLALTHDGTLLIAAAQKEVVFLDVARLTAGGEAVLGSFSDGEGSGSIYANVTADDKTLFVSEERARAITVIDLERARKNGFKSDAIIGRIPVGNAPIALTFSLDGKWLYTTSQGALPDWNWPKACTREGRGSPDIVNPEGAVIVVDVEKAKADPAGAVVSRVPAGCSPVRLAMSAKGDRLYVTARNSNSVIGFDSTKLVGDAAHARLGVVPVGTSPVPVAVVGATGNEKILAGNSNRFADAQAGQSLTVIDAARIADGAAAVAGTIPAGGFPREMRLSSDGHTLFLTNFGSKSLQMIDVARLPIS